ncbi:hypothetical protein [Bradyrhizobium sp.]|uniref:hypothetical protein n=1 Tax=Bradyrhizobium sp. TaxID=376 RepID=UPI0025B8D8E1|nr:hypothetical protein [Bradyrhizobium sp.]MBV8920693.1 hypothetical protein [Bradyrhizobium sp.]
MQAAQRQQAIDPAEVGIELEQPESGTGFSGVVRDVIARIGVWLYEVRAASPAPRRPRVARRSFGGALLKMIVVLLLFGGIAGAALAWQYPRSEMVRMMVAEYAPQRVIDLLPAVDPQDAAMEANAELRTTVGNTGGYQVPGMDNGEANANLSPMEQQQLIQKLARDVENLQQGIDQLRAGQDQMLRMMLRTPAAQAQARAQVVPPRPAGATTGLAAGLPGLAPNPPQPRRPAVPPPPRFYQ